MSKLNIPLLMVLTLFAVTACAPKPGDPDFVVARVEDKKITQAQLEDRMAPQLDRFTEAGQDVTEEIRKMIEWRSLEQLVMEEMIQAAAAEDLDTDLETLRSESESQFEEFKQQAPDAAAFEEQLAQQGITEEMIKNEFFIRSLVQALMEARYPDGHAVSDEEAKTFYDDNPQMFEQPERVTARHILVQVDPSATKEEKATKKEEIDAARKRVAGGEEFATVASEVSDDRGSGSRGGMLPPFTKGQMVPPFEKVAFAAKKGDLSSVFETQFGFHFLEVLDHSEAQTLSYDDVKGDISQHLKQKAQSQAAQTLIAEIESSIDHEYFIEDPTAAPPAPDASMPTIPSPTESDQPAATE